MSTLEDVSATKDVSHVDDEMVDGVSSLHLPLDVDNLTHLIRSINLDLVRERCKFRRKCNHFGAKTIQNLVRDWNSPDNKVFTFNEM